MMTCNHNYFEAMRWLIQKTTIIAYGNEGCLSSCEVNLEYESGCEVKGFRVNIFFIYNPTIHKEIYLSWEDVFTYREKENEFHQMIDDTLWEIHTKAMKKIEND